MAVSLLNQVPSPLDNPSVTQPALASAVETELRGSQYLALRHLTCEVHDGTVALYGRVPSYYLKQVAQTNVGQIQGIQHVDNHIQVAVS